MKRFYLQFRVMLIALALGLASVGFVNWLNDYLTVIPVDLPKVESGSPIFVFIGDKYMRSGGSGNSSTIHFIITAYACGGIDEYGGIGCLTNYRTDNGQTLFTYTSGYGSIKNAKRVLDLEISKAVSIIDNTTIFKRKTKLQQRRVIKVGTDNLVEIIKYDGKNSIDRIGSETLELPLAFEQWKRSQQKNTSSQNENVRNKN